MSEKKEKEKQLDNYYLHILSDIQSRFATTQITSRIANRSDAPEETLFVASLPDAAFITYFEMEVNGEVIVGEIKEKQKAEEAKDKGETAGHVAQKLRESNKFKISVNIKAGEEARFKLIYQELLNRVRGVYKHQINIQPGQSVSDLQIDVHITEKLPFRLIHVPKFATKLNAKSNKELLGYNKAADVTVETSREDGISKAWIQWRPSVESQESLGQLDGQLVVLYDVEREEDIGQIQVVDGYFLHCFAPTNLEVGNKNIVFALDTSGSMLGDKIFQTKEAMNMILSQLRPRDQLNIIAFDVVRKPWSKKCVKATEDNVRKADKWVWALEADGGDPKEARVYPDRGSNIDRAIKEGISELIKASKRHALEDILILLTDGQHIGGFYWCDDLGQIGPLAAESMKDRPVKIYGLGFGEDADFGLLKQISSMTGGMARRIYAELDAAVQLKNFFEEISSPVLANVSIRYLNPDVDLDSIVGNNDGKTFYDGSEMVYAGRLKQNTELESLETEIQGRSVDGDFWRKKALRNTGRFPDLVPETDPLPIQGHKEMMFHSVGGIIERSWAYLTIKKLLEKSKAGCHEETAEKLRKEVLDLSLKYGFVTPVTSMVTVLHGEGERKEVLLEEAPSDGCPPSSQYIIKTPPPSVVIDQPPTSCGYQTMVCIKEVPILDSYGRIPKLPVEPKFDYCRRRELQWLKKSLDEISREFNERMNNFEPKTTLLHLLRNTDLESAGKAMKLLISQLVAQPCACCGFKEPKFNVPRVQRTIEKLESGEQPSKSDWIVCCLVVGRFSKDEMEGVCQSLMGYQSSEVTFDATDTLHVEPDPNEAGGSGIGHCALYMKGGTECEGSLDVKSQSIFDGIEVMYKLTNLWPPILLASGVARLFSLLFESPGKNPERNNDVLAQAEQKIRSAILKS